jgi:hypothetical protein
LANRESRMAEFCREAQSENGWRSVCAFIQKWRFGFYLPFLREAVRAIGSRGTAKKRQRYFRVVCWLRVVPSPSRCAFFLVTLCLLPQ